MKQRKRKRILSVILAILLLCQGTDISVLAQNGKRMTERVDQLLLGASLSQEGLCSEAKISPNSLQGDMSAVFRNPYDDSSPDRDVSVYYLAYTQNIDGTLVDKSAMCLSYGGKSTMNTNRCTYSQCTYPELLNQSGNSIITDKKNEQLKGATYAYEKITHGTSYLEGIKDSEYEKLKSEIEQTTVPEYQLGTDGYNRLAYSMLQIAAWRISCDTFTTTSRNNSSQAAYIQDTATVKSLVSQLFGRSEDDTVTRQAIAMYDYIKMMVYQSSGAYKANYTKKFEKVDIFYFRPVATHPETEQWYEFQNLMTWRVYGSKEYEIKLSKTGTQSDLPVKDATYGIYADAAATILLSTLTTNSAGEVISEDKFTEGNYYIKEITAPLGYELDTRVSPVTITSSTEDNTIGTKVDEKEKFEASVTLYKYDSASQDATNKKGLSGATFEIQQYCSAKKKYVAIGNLKDEGTGKYTLEGQSFKILDANGNATGKTITGKLLYTQQNEGKFRIVETAAPAGYTISDEVKTFTVSGENQVFTFDNEDAFYETGLEGTVSVTKYDSLTKEKLSGAKFELQEYNVNQGKWLSCGNLSEEKDENGNGTGIYSLSDYVKYNYHAGDGTTIVVSKRSKLVYTAYNKGQFRIVETAAPAKYKNTDLYQSEIFTLSESQKSFQFRYYETADALQQGAKNTGYYNTVRVAKYDAVTKKKVASGTSVFTIYEFIENQNQWYEVGTMKYNSTSMDYSCYNQTFRFRDSGGTVIPQERMDDAGCQAGRLYYTSANKGKFKVVETKAPDKYTLGATPYSREFQITDANGNGYEFGFTDITKGAKNTGISGSAEVTKYDYYTKQKVAGAVFTVYEYAASKKDYSRAVGTMVDTGNGSYTTDGGTYKIHAEDGSYTSFSGLVYTTENEGKFKIVETKAPAGYTKEAYDQLITITTDGQKFTFNDYATGAKDKPVTGSVELVKVDSDTKQKLTGAEFELQEYNNVQKKYIRIGTLKDMGTGSYISEGSYKYHGKDATVILAKTEDYPELMGKLLVTSYNDGKFKIVETKAPENYWVGDIPYTRAFTVTETDKNFKFNTTDTWAENYPYYGTVSVTKQDAITGDYLTGAEFTLYEWNTDSNTYQTLCELKDMGNGTYSLEGVTLKQMVETVSGRKEQALTSKVRYTSINQGKFKVVETKAPKNYTAGLTTFSREFQLKKLAGSVDEHVYSRSTGAKNTGISGSAEVTKYDYYTKQKVAGAVFTIYEYAASKKNYSRAVGTMVDTGDGSYTTDGGTYKIHAKDGNYTTFSSLVYTTENEGKFKIVETKAPAGYTKEAYDQLITLTTDGQKFTFNDYATGAKDKPVTGSVELVKVDSDTKQKLTGAVFELQEYNNVLNKYIRIGTLKDCGDGTYRSEGDYNYHGSDENTVLSRTEDYMDLIGKLLVTSYNEGKFRIVELVPPVNYWIGDIPYTRAFTVTETDKNFKFNTTDTWAENYPYYGTVSVTKQDAVTGDYLTGAEFTLYEWNTDSNTYQSLCTLKDMGNGTYSLEGVTLKQMVETVSGRKEQALTSNVRYTSINQGKFKVVETKAPFYYMEYDADGITFSQEFNIRNSEDSNARQVNENTVAYQYSADAGAKNLPSRGELTVIKKDSGTEDGTAQGDATLSGAVYLLIPREDILHPDATLEDGVLYPAPENTEELVSELKEQEKILNDITGVFTEEDIEGALARQEEIKTVLKSYSVAELITALDENEICRAEASNLPLGKYYLAEVKAPEGYLLNGELYPIDLIYDNEPVPLVHKEIQVEETVKKQAFSFTKYRRNPLMPEELQPLEGAGFKVYQVSQLQKVKESGIEITAGADKKLEETIAELYQVPDCREDCKTYDFSMETSATDELFSDINGLVTSPELPYGIYVVAETTNPTDDSADIRPFVVNIADDGEKVYKTETGVAASSERVACSLEKKEDELLSSGSIKISKTGDTLSDVEVVPYQVRKEEISGLTQDVSASNKMFKYEEVALEKVSFSVTVLNDIYLPDGRTDAEGNPVLAGYTRADGTHIQLKKDAVVDIIVTDSEGKAELNHLPYGTYRVTEVETPKGYLKAEPFEVTIGSGAGEETAPEIKVYNDRKKMNASLVKQSKDGKQEELSGAVYGLYTNKDICTSSGKALAKAGELLEVCVAGADGCMQYQSDLPFGSYYYKEIQAPEGYTISGERYEFDFSADSEVDESGRLDIKAVLQDGPTEVRISKKSFTSGVEIAGAELQILDAENHVVANWITDGKEHEIKGLPAGTYTLKETRAPYGYLVSEEVEFSVSDSGEISKVEMYDKEFKGCLEIIKVDGATDEKLAGAVFELRNESGEVLDTLVTDENGYAKSNEVFICTYDNSTGEYQDAIKYYLAEVKAPEGYLPDSTVREYSFEYQDDHTPVITIQSIISNDQTRVRISKKSFTSGVEIAGAELQILDADDKQIISWTTDGSEKEITGLKPGTYTLKETRAPYGYLVSEEVEFSVSDSGEISKVVMYDKEVKGCIEIIKVDGATDEKLAGAVFELRNESGEVLDTLVTDENGYAKSNEVFICTYDNSTGEYQESIKYYLAEVKAPEGYVIDTGSREYSFEYQDDHTPVVTIRKVIENDKTPDTGDDTEPWKQKYLYLLLMAAFTVGGGYIIGRKRKDS